MIDGHPVYKNRISATSKECWPVTMDNLQFENTHVSIHHNSMGLP